MLHTLALRTPRVGTRPLHGVTGTRRQLRVRSSEGAVAPAAAAATPAQPPVASPSSSPSSSEQQQQLPAITLTDKALAHLNKLRQENGGGAASLLRVGVKQGGCSGMSYVMDFEKPENVAADDYTFTYPDGFRLVCDPKSLLYLFGMHLDYSDALIGGGFNFQNPNAHETCGCGKSFGV